MAITASEARKHLFPLIEQVNEDRTPVEITSKRGDALAGAWSRRVDQEHRLVYLVDGDDVVILQARYHYG
jgi:Txe/YoeB family toxin of toxin-antitoxin system